MRKIAQWENPLSLDYFTKYDRLGKFSPVEKFLFIAVSVLLVGAFISHIALKVYVG